MGGRLWWVKDRQIYYAERESLNIEFIQWVMEGKENRERERKRERRSNVMV